jgi:hypothetical protein
MKLRIGENPQHYPLRTSTNMKLALRAGIVLAKAAWYT